MHPSIGGEMGAKFIKINFFRNLEICQILARTGQVFTQENLKFGKGFWVCGTLSFSSTQVYDSLENQKPHNYGSHEGSKP